MQMAFSEPLTLENKWAGAISRLSTSCDYTIEMQARVLSNQNHGGGYGIASGSLDADSLPRGPAFQYDFGFSGYRVLAYPNDFAQPAGSSEQATLNDNWHTLKIVVSGGITAYVDGSYALQTASQDSCGRPMIRVWSATVQFRNIKIRQGKS
jgi:hypothetical protein